MSIFKSILAKVLHRDDHSTDAGGSGAQQASQHNGQASSGAGSQGNPAQQGSAASQTSSVGGGASPAANQPPGGSSQAAAQPTQGQQSQAGQAAGSSQNASGTQTVDVDAVLTKMQSQHAEKLNWKTSIVDLLKLLGLDSSLAARKQLASELNYQGSTDDSAAMNIWLHKEVMRKLAENGGKLPADIKM